MIAIRLALCLLALVLPGVPVDAAWLALCEDTPADAEGRRYLRPNGTETTLIISDQAVEGCRQSQIEVAATQIRWAGLVPDDLAARLDDGVSLLGDFSEGATTISEIIPTKVAAESPARRPVALSLGTNTLSQWDRRLFGNPARASLQQLDGKLGLKCAAGDHSAGLLLTATQYALPVAANLRATIEYTATANFPVGFSDATQLAREAPVVIGKLGSHASAGRETLPLPITATSDVHGLSLLCPDHAAELWLENLELRAESMAPVTNRSTWVWQGHIALRDPAALVKTLQAADMDTLFIALPLEGSPPTVADAKALGDLIQQAGAQGIDTWAVEGDARAVTLAGRQPFLERTRALTAFNATQPGHRQLKGVQYDIEPYLLPGFDLAKEDWLRAYLETLRILRREISMPMEVAVPFWWPELSVDGEPILTVMAPLIEGLTVMNYRTDPDQLQRLAEPFLAWGTTAQRYVRIALESLALPDQSLANFRRGRTGRLWQVSVAGAEVLLLLKEPANNPTGNTFGRAYTVQVPATGTTFHDQPDRLAQAIPRLVEHWSAWPSFAGTALHGYLDSFD